MWGRPRPMLPWGRPLSSRRCVRLRVRVRVCVCVCVSVCVCVCVRERERERVSRWSRVVVSGLAWLFGCLNACGGGWKRVVFLSTFCAGVSCAGDRDPAHV